MWARILKFHVSSECSSIHEWLSWCLLLIFSSWMDTRMQASKYIPPSQASEWTKAILIFIWKKTALSRSSNGAQFHAFEKVRWESAGRALAFPSRKRPSQIKMVLVPRGNVHREERYIFEKGGPEEEPISWLMELLTISILPAPPSPHQKIARSTLSPPPLIHHHISWWKKTLGPEL